MLFRFLFFDDMPSFVKFCDDNICDIIKPLLNIILRDFFYVFRVYHLPTCNFFLFINEPEFCIEIDPGTFLSRLR
jgi:hypothetical protein